MSYELVNKNKQFNFQINRVLTYGEIAGDSNLIIKNLADVRNIKDWYAAWAEIARDAERKQSYMHTAYAYRMAEFFMKEDNPEKEVLYNRAVENFYKAFQQFSIPYTVHDIPYKKTELHSVFLQAPNSRATILVCGGYDSFIEEFVPAVFGILKQGYSLILFEGDGQGRTLKNGLPFIHNWEEPTGAVLDYYQLQDCPMIGISWGGYLAMRAAAYEKRITAVAAYDVATDGYEIMTNLFPGIIKGVVCSAFNKGNEKSVNRIVRWLQKKSIIADWAFTQGEYITHTATPYAFYQELKKHTLKGVTDRITQDCLLLAGESDHYIPRNQFIELRKSLKNAHSVKARMFTKAEGGEQHCQIGNHNLAVSEILSWLKNIER